MSQEAKDTPAEDSPNDNPGDASSIPATAGTDPSDSDMPAVVRVLQRADNAVGVLEQALLALFLATLIATGATQAIAIRLDIVLGYWTGDVIRYSVFFTAMAGAALSAHTGQLIAMDFVTRMLSPRPRAYLQIALRLFTIAMCLLLVVYGLDVAEIASPVGTIPANKGLLALPIGAGAMAFHIAVHLVIDIVYLTSGRLPPTPDERSLHAP